ncbi:MAG: acyltransferase family protein [Patescibacteria group bacterium]
MQIELSSQTIFFIVLLLLVVVLTIKKSVKGGGFSTTLTNGLKGVAILMVIFSHVGYFLTSDHTFLYPLSVAGGIGVNVFLLLSGFGFTTSALKSSISLKEFYFKRLKKIFIPMWVVLGPLLILDFLVLGRHYGFKTVLDSFLGWFPRADVFLDIDSPLWYFTAILFYYLLFPLIFSKRQPFLSAILMLLLGCILVDLKLPVVVDVLKLYKLHYMAFPFGMLLAILLRQRLTIPTVASRPILLTVKFADSIFS